MRTGFYFFVVALLFLTSCQANGQKMLYIYAGMDDGHAIKAFEQFEQDTGIRVVFKRLSNGKILSLLEEGETTIDIWYGGPSILFEEAKQQGLLYPYQSKTREEIDTRYLDEEGYWTGVYVSILALVANQQWHMEQGIELPKRWTDLQRVEYKNWLTLPDPQETGTGYLTLTLFQQIYGELRVQSVVQNINHNVSEYTSTGQGSGRVVGAKKSAATIMFAHDALRLKKEGYNDLVVIYPNEPTTYEIGAVAITQMSENKELAKMFVDWALTTNAQEIGKRIGNYQYLTNVNASQPVQAISPADLLISTPDHEQASRKQGQWLTQFEKWRAKEQ
ncbi:extracellular solute-binding protein [Shouchella clausii]|uniref:extracellular solute-binding protein n=1 Tax=Shouchella clausii TaxID=79880 RepID=UPI000BA4E7F5|nr:extracellular solute-binding protein [Shouchella clausii]MDO7283815.1 extracellular solute-binding protein [Shouchella clausii]MDO7303911.1 extracellular solute-binding protein [Shouchella clausii]MEB5479211.1 extracellular solute-binding protein [Shouchella clausii]MED4158724.1 extracellular solute-binding protein [Shouchella clausii]MED4176479.1 extracellular solute-binding protein [Shouchella clausii]